MIITAVGSNWSFQCDKCKLITFNTAISKNVKDFLGLNWSADLQNVFYQWFSCKGVNMNDVVCT